MTKLPFLYVGLPAMLAVGSFTLGGRAELRAEGVVPDYPMGTSRVDVPEGTFAMGSAG